jgi:5-methylcytosine-specific restriction enzyme subunit McrC
MRNAQYHLNLSYYIGVDWIPDTNQPIYVAPKLNTKLKEDGTPDNNISIEDIKQTDYLKMLFSALKHHEASKHTDELFEIKWNAPEIEITQQQDLLTPLLVVQFLKVVKKIVRKGLKKSYYKVDSNLYAKVKGKVLVSKTINRNLLKNKPLNTYCSYEEFGLNGLENRLLKRALVFIQRYLPTIKNIHSEKYSEGIFNYINPAFEFVSEVVELNDVKHAKTNAFYKEYEEGLRLAKLILKRFGYNISNTQQQTIKTPPFWIDMSKLFELYVLGLLEDKYGNEVKFQFQGKGTYLDYLLTKADEKKVIDAKYKPKYKTTYDIEDIRQLSGYARDRKVMCELGITSNDDQEKVVLPCLIIYPDQSEKVSEKLFENDRESIVEFVRFEKQAVKLPVI